MRGAESKTVDNTRVLNNDAIPCVTVATIRAYNNVRISWLGDTDRYIGPVIFTWPGSWSRNAYKQRMNTQSLTMCIVVLQSHLRD